MAATLALAPAELQGTLQLFSRSAPDAQRRILNQVSTRALGSLLQRDNVVYGVHPAGLQTEALD